MYLGSFGKAAVVRLCVLMQINKGCSLKLFNQFSDAVLLHTINCSVNFNFSFWLLKSFSFQLLSVHALQWKSYSFYCLVTF